MNEYRSLREKLSDLLDQNVGLPLSYQLPLASFIVNTEKYEHLQKTASDKREAERLAILEKIKSQDRVTEWIKETCWNSMQIIGTEMHSIFTNKIVENNSLPPTKSEDQETASMNLLKTVESSDDKNLLQTWKMAFGNEDDNFDPIMDELKESTANDFIDPAPFICSQAFMHSFLQINWNAQKTKNITRALQVFFNENFNKTMMLKQKELKLAKERSDRLQFIITELNALRKLKGNCEKIECIIDVPEWVQNEIPENLIIVKPNELTNTPYVSPSQMIEPSIDVTPKNPFYDRALNNMMDGTLDKLWHDEIKKDIPKPQCMIEKNSEDLNELDLAEISEWEEKIANQKKDRERYGNMLHDEFKELTAIFNGMINKFNEKHNDLYSLKLKVESAIAQEELKLMILRVSKSSQIEAVDRERNLQNEILSVEMEQERVYSELNDIQLQLSEYNNAKDAFMGRSKMLDKSFRNNFPEASAAVVDLCFKLFHKRPKWQPKSTMTAAMLLEMAQGCLMKEIPMSMNSDCIKYLKALEQLDLISNMPPIMDEATWNNMCKLRRIKIENEIKENANKAEISDIEAAYVGLQKNLVSLKSYQQILKTDLSNHHMFMENQTKNSKLQFAIKSGLIEIKSTGHLDDFKGAILIKREEIETINDQIKKAEEIKNKAEQKTIDFKKFIMTREWEHAKLKMQVTQLESDLYYFERIKVTKEVQKYIQDRAIQKYSKQDIENRLQITKSHFHRQLYYQIQYTEELEMKIGTVQTNIQTIDSRIIELKKKIIKKREQLEMPSNKERKEQIIKRMKALVWRKNLVDEVQKQHTTIILLQTELELQRLRTYPTLTAYQPQQII